ncbi:TIPRL [Bugula neritina]|uniref:TIPRL n=1 Tax=Bugula neritina TaxID=10212 RepID=A0A7J7JY08_BUGNE|nr:TIPRL [Bugula neritina]
MLVYNITFSAESVVLHHLSTTTNIRKKLGEKLMIYTLLRLHSLEFLKFPYLSHRQLSRFEKILSPLSQTPEMTYDQKILRVTHTEGFGTEFSALNALKLANEERDLMKVAVSEAWKSSSLFLLVLVW